MIRLAVLVVAALLALATIELIVKVGANDDGPPNTYGAHRWDHVALTHSGPPELDDLVGAALDAWGRYSAITDAGPGSDIVIAYQSTPSVSAAFATWSHHDATIDGCRIEVSDDLDLDLARQVIAHEVGHCLGLSHPRDVGLADLVSVMNNAYREIEPYDQWSINRLYPRAPMVYQATVPGVTR